MVKSRFSIILSRFTDIRPEETSSASILFFYFFITTFSIYIIKPVKISLFFHWFSIERLPYAYLLTALLISPVVLLNFSLLHRIKRQRYISLSLVFFMTSLILFWLFFRLQWSWLSLVYWIWSDVFAVASVTNFWISVNDNFHSYQAKRLVGFLVSGGLLGGIGGSLVSSSMARVLGTENLLLVCPLILGLGLILINRLYRHQAPEMTKEEKTSAEEEIPKMNFSKSLQLFKKNRYLLLIAGVIAAAVIVSTLVDFQFNSVVRMNFPEKNVRTSFLGTFFALLLIFSYLLHVLLTSRILRNFGIRAGLMIIPLFLLAGSVTIFLIPLASWIYWAVIFKGADKSLDHTLSQAVRELLYLPISPEIKYKAKIFIDMFVNKFANGLGAFLLLLFSSVFKLKIKEISLLTLSLISVWIILNLFLHKEYVNIVKRKLKVKWLDAEKLVMESIDVEAAKLVFDTIESRERSSVLYAMNLFELIRKEKLGPELKKIIASKSDEIKARSMDSLLLENYEETLGPQLDDEFDAEGLSLQVKEILSMNVYQELMARHIEKILKETTKEPEVVRMEVAKVLGIMEPDSPLVSSLPKLLRDESPEVLRYAVESAGKIKRKDFVPFIIQHLSQPSLKRAAMRALVKHGPRIIGTLKDYLGDEEEDIRVRKAITDILAQIGTQSAADALVIELARRKEDVESETIEALYKLRLKNPHIWFDPKVVTEEIIRKIKKCYELIEEMLDAQSEGKKEDISRDLEKNLAHSLKQIFELLSLIYPVEDIRKAYQNISSGTKKKLNDSLELLENIIKKELKRFLLPLLEDIPLEDKARKCQGLLKALDRALEKQSSTNTTRQKNKL